MKSFYECSFFTKENFKICKHFTVEQEEIVLGESPTTSDPNAKYAFKKQLVEYRCSWQKQDNWDSKKPTIFGIDGVDFSCREADQPVGAVIPRSGQWDPLTDVVAERDAESFTPTSLHDVVSVCYHRSESES